MQNRPHRKPYFAINHLISLINFPSPTQHLLFALLVFIISFMLGAPAKAAKDHTDWVELPGHVLPALSKAQPIATPKNAADESLSLTIVLRRSDEAGFQSYLDDVYDSNSPRFMQFLTPVEVSNRFGPSKADFTQVQKHFVEQGFSVIEGSNNRMTLTLKGNKSITQKTFRITIRQFLPANSEGRVESSFYANTNEPLLPITIASRIQSIVGLSNLAQSQRQPAALSENIKKLEDCVKKGTGAAILCGIGYFFLAVIYDIGCISHLLLDCTLVPLIPSTTAAGTPAIANLAKATGSGQKIGIVAFDSFKFDDVSDFLALVNAPANQLNQLSLVELNGGAPIGANEAEVLLDINTVMMLAPGAQYAVYSTPFTGAGSFQAIFNRMINDQVTIVSNSWAYCENQTTLADVQSIDSILASAAASGISVFSASGDTGSTCLNGSPNTSAVPASSPNITAVGGTSVEVGPQGIYESEKWWDGTNDIPSTGQGGFGVSRFFSRPSYQNGLTTSSMRSIPDIAVNADPAANGVPICQASNGGCPSPLLYGGTSIGAPIMAAFTALMNDTRNQNLGFLNPLIYPLADTDAFHSSSSMGSDFAHVGLGSPNISFLHLALQGRTPNLPSSTLSRAIASFDSNPADGSSTITVVVQLRDANGSAVSGKTISLTASPGSSAVITPASGVSTVDNGAVVFTVTNTEIEDVTFTARDVTDNILLEQKPTISFVSPPAASGGISANPPSVPANGTSIATITITLRDSLNRPSSGKEITLSQKNGRSVVVGPSPSVTDANGEIQFTATNLFEETVIYTAINVTDGDLPIPGSATITYSNAPSVTCISDPPNGASGFTVTPFATGFVAENIFFGGVDWGGCPGASNPTFATDGSVYIASFPEGGLYKLPSQGGTATTVLSDLGPTLGQPVFGKDGSLYVARGATTGGRSSGAILQIDPDSGAIIRTVADNLTCPVGLSVDPLSGDLFFNHVCFGAGLDDPSLRRVRNPNNATPTVEVYTTLPSTPNGEMSFAPNGTLYVVSGYTNRTAPVLEISGTNTPSPTITTLTDVTTNFWVTVGEVLPNGAAKSLIVLNENDGVLESIDITTNPVTVTRLTDGPASSGVIGPDGCLYFTGANAVYKLTPNSGNCGFAATNPAPALTLSPSTVSPNPAQGTELTMTAQFSNLNVPADTPVFFNVSGDNTQVRLVRTDANGKAIVAIQSLFAGRDVITASATVGNDSLTSNRAIINWAAGRHVTDMNLNLGPEGGTLGDPVTVSATLVDVSAIPTAAIAGQRVNFTIGNQTCSANTNASGRASCNITPNSSGQFTRTVNYVGNAQFLPASASDTFFVLGPPPILFDNFDQ